MAIPTNLNLRQTIEGMPLTFNTDAAEGLTAAIQFHVTGDEPGDHFLHIANGECEYNEGVAKNPSLTITTPSDVWLKISRKEISGQDAMMQELYTAEGDLSLLLQMDALFSDEVTMEAANQRPAGPISLSGMSWMTVGFIPWIAFWIMFDIPSIPAWLKVGLPFIVSVLTVGYRWSVAKVNSRLSFPPTWFDWGSLGFFTLAGILTMTGDVGFPVWGSVISSVVMAGLWLGSIVFAKMPLSANYSKWQYVKTLWSNSIFIHVNAVISLMWGWQFIVASLIGIAAMLLPQWHISLTVLRYLLLIPAFIFTAQYQKRALSLHVDEAAIRKNRFWAEMGLSAVSGLLLAATMPNFNVGLLGWIAVVPLLMILNTTPAKRHYLLALPFGLIWSAAVHNWYPHIFPPALGYFLIFAVGSLYASVLVLGIMLQNRLHGWLKLLAVPVVWATFEFIKFIAPVVNAWWFVLLAKSQWRFPPALQILTVGGFPALSFIIMLANVAIAMLLLQLMMDNLDNLFVDRHSKIVTQKSSIIALALVALILVWGWSVIPKINATETFVIASVTDMSGADPAILAQGGELFQAGIEGPYADTPEMSQALFDVNVDLTRQATFESPESPAFVVWSENEFADADDAQFMGQLSDLARETGAYIMADTIWRSPTGIHDTALLMGANGTEAGRWAKIHLFPSEADYGLSAGKPTFHTIETPYGNVGGGVCYDYHYLDVVRGLAQNGAQIVLMPTDDNFNGTPWFPPFHASDAVFRATEHRLAFATGTVNGLGVVVDPYGRITAEGKTNERGVATGKTFTVSGQTFYTRFGDWFGWLMVGILVVLVWSSKLKRKSELSYEQ
ncbi:nitrilase-related carbon-nitrogen hydrolase [Anaerolineales bacterium HSG6]|nr:nitrilase-related carbon-nitrogen hydrolase [Anaerolineales bacterium HSG6]